MFTSVLRPHRTTTVFAAAPRAPKLVRMIVIPVILLVVAVVVAVVAGLAWSAKLPGNAYVGIRAPEARKSKENWDITHRVAGPPWAVSALAFAGAAALAFLAIRPEASGWMWLWVVVAGLLGLAMLGVGGAIGSHTIALYDAKKSAESGSDGCCSSGGSSDTGACGSGCGCGSAEAATCDSNTAGTANSAGTTATTGADACCTPTEAADPSCCSTDASADATSAAATNVPRDPSADCGVTGGCGSCGLNGMCEDGNATFGSANARTANTGTAVDRDALRRAARATDGE